MDLVPDAVVGSCEQTEQIAAALIVLEHRDVDESGPEGQPGVVHRRGRVGGLLRTSDRDDVLGVLRIAAGILKVGLDAFEHLRCVEERDVGVHRSAAGTLPCINARHPRVIRGRLRPHAGIDRPTAPRQIERPRRRHDASRRDRHELPFHRVTELRGLHPHRYEAATLDEHRLRLLELDGVQQPPGRTDAVDFASIDAERLGLGPLQRRQIDGVADRERPHPRHIDDRHAVSTRRDSHRRDADRLRGGRAISLRRHRPSRRRGEVSRRRHRHDAEDADRGHAHEGHEGPSGSSSLH